DQASMDLMFPELVRRRERQQRRAQPGDQPERDDAPSRRRSERNPSTLRRGSGQASSGRGRSPEARMRRALNSPNRVVIEMSQAKLLRAVYSERQLEEVMTDFWFNHFNVFFGKGLVRWLTSSYERDAIRPHVLGKFRDLLGATAGHPAMLFYLDNWMSAAPGSDAGDRALRASYARYLEEQGRTVGSLPVEILQRRGADTARLERMLEMQTSMMAMDSGMRAGRRDGRRGRLGRRQRPEQQQQRRRRQRGLNENYARELLELHTLGVDGGYTQQDVIEVARCFTGWTMVPLHIGPSDFIYLDELHDKGTKVVLGQEIENGGRHDGERVLDMVARHPSTARFLSTKLARRFVADDPPASLVTKMAETFRRTDGDIRAVLRTLFTAEEFWSPAAVRAKVKTPFEFVASAARATGAELADFPPGLALSLRELGMPLYAAEPPTGYKDTAEAWVSTGGLLNRMKIALGLAVNRLPGTRVRIPAAWRQAETTDELVAAISKQVLYQPMSLTTRAALDAELKKIPKANPIGGRQAPARIALGWLLASPEFQRR
ncbi:MAG: DUF1800 domain-containing protein, partial [Terriglobia bacterium]